MYFMGEIQSLRKNTINTQLKIDKEFKAKIVIIFHCILCTVI